MQKIKGGLQAGGAQGLKQKKKDLYVRNFIGGRTGKEY
jgi:hypothetical protein